MTAKPESGARGERRTVRGRRRRRPDAPSPWSVLGESLTVIPAVVAALVVPGLAIYAPTGMSSLEVAGAQAAVLVVAAPLSFIGFFVVVVDRARAHWAQPPPPQPREGAGEDDDEPEATLSIA